MANVGVTALAKALKKSKGTISKHADAGKIPVADRDAHGHPLFDVEAVRAVYDQQINPLMRRTGAGVAPSEDDDQLGFGDEETSGSDAADQSERRSAPTPRAPSGLVQQQTLERRLKNRRLLRQIADDEALFVLKSISDEEKLTLARKTRDGVSAQLSDAASALYAFVSRQARTEAELRIWLIERTGIAFNEVAMAIAAEEGDEFDDEQPEPATPADESGEPSAAPAS
jgi:hypothetical protein